MARLRTTATRDGARLRVKRSECAPVDAYISPLPRLDHQGRLTPPSMLNVLPVM
jgi:hypothetical protein